MEKTQINERIKEKYAINESLEEQDVKNEDKKLYKEVIKVYGNWEKALKSNGIIKRNIREREKFILYSVMKRRYELYGEEALRPKNVKPDEIKERIVESFKTLKSLTNTVKNWDEEKIMYELRAEFLTGRTIEEIEKENPELYEQLLYHFKNLSHAKEEYYKRFGGTAEFVYSNFEDEMEEVVSKGKTSRNNQVPEGGNEGLIEMLVKLNYIKNENEAKIVQEANTISKEQMIGFLFECLAEVTRKGEKLNEDYVYERNPVMFYALKAEYGTLQNAFDELRKTVVQVG